MTLGALHVAVIAGTAFVVLGFGGMLLRRSILVVVMSGTLSMLGVALVLVALAVARRDAVGLGAAMLLVLLSASWALAGASVALTTYRRRGTESIDELRELRG